MDIVAVLGENGADEGAEVGGAVDDEHAMAGPVMNGRR